MAKTSKKENSPYADYMRYYPDKWAAISALRCNTGMTSLQAARTIEQLFGTSLDEEVKAADAEQEKIYQAQQAEESRRKAKAAKSRKTAGLVIGGGLYAVLGTIFQLSKKYK